MKTLPLLLLGCSQIDLPKETQERCKPEITALHETCNLWDGSFDRAVREARKCIGEDVRIICSNPGPFEPKVLSIKK